MGFLTGDETISIHNTYFFSKLHHVLNMVIHVFLVMPGTIVRNRHYERQRATNSTFYLNISVIFLLHIISTVLDALLFSLHLAEFVFALCLSPIGILLYPIMNREDAINTMLNAVETVFPRLCFEKLDTVIQLSVPRCDGRGNCGRLVTMGRYREVDWACENCCAFLQRLKELNTEPHVLGNVNIRGRVVSEYCALTRLKERLISKKGLANLMTTEYLLFSTFDVTQRKWKRVFVIARNESIRASTVTYVKRDFRTGRIELSAGDCSSVEYGALKSFASVAPQWNRLKRSRYNRRTRNVIQVIVPVALIALLGAANVALASFNGASSPLKALAIVLGAQIAWFEIVSEAVLLGIPDQRVSGGDFRRIGTKRARAIRYVDLGDRDGLFSAEGMSWKSEIAGALVGNGTGIGVLPIELLLNANKIVTSKFVYDFSASARVGVRRTVSVERVGNTDVARVHGGGEEDDCDGFGLKEKGQFLVG